MSCYYVLYLESLLHGLGRCALHVELVRVRHVCFSELLEDCFLLGRVGHVLHVSVELPQLVC